MQRFWYKRLLLQSGAAASLAGAKSMVAGQQEDVRWKKLTGLLMQLRKACNHPFLFPGAEPEPIVTGPTIVTASGKMQVLDKLLDRLKGDGHRVLLYSQFTLVLDVLEVRPVTPYCHHSVLLLRTVTPYCYSVLSPLRTVTPYCYSVLSLRTVTLYCYSVLSLCTVTPYCHSVLSLCTVTPYCHSVLSLRTVTPYCHSALLLRTVTTPYCYVVLLFCTVTLYCY
jgi:hypothetical protein